MKRNPVLGITFALPAILLLIAFLIYPTIRTVQLSFTNSGLLGGGEYVGLDNYVRLFTNDKAFFNIEDIARNGYPSGAVFTTILWLVLFTTVTVGLGVIIAVAANAVRYEVLVKTIIFVPLAISFTAAGIIWRFVYSPDEKTGILNALLVGFIPGADPINFLGRGDIINFAIIAAGIWLYTGFCMVIISAALKGLPGEVLEAARVDGANNWSLFWKVIVPLLWPTIVVVSTTMIINVLKAFDLVFVMTEGTGGPRRAAGIIGFVMYNEAFQNNKFGYGAAVAVI